MPPFSSALEFTRSWPVWATTAGCESNHQLIPSGSPTSQRQRRARRPPDARASLRRGHSARRRPCAGRAALQDLQAVHKWKVVPERRCLGLSRLIGYRIGVHHMRPDVFGISDAELREALGDVLEALSLDDRAARWCLSPFAVAPNGSSGASSATRARAKPRKVPTTRTAAGELRIAARASRARPTIGCALSPTRRRSATRRHRSRAASASRSCPATA